VPDDGRNAPKHVIIIDNIVKICCVWRWRVCYCWYNKTQWNRFKL